MDLKRSLGIAALALATALPLGAQSYSQGWLVGPLVQKKEYKGFWKGTEETIVPERAGPQTYAPGETIARAAFRRVLDSRQDGPDVLGAVLAYAGKNGNNYLVDFTCSQFVGYESGVRTTVQRSLAISEPAIFSLTCSGMSSDFEQPRQKIKLTVLNIDEHGNATIDAKVLPLYTEKPEAKQ